MMFPFTRFMTGFGSFGFIFMILFWGLIIWGIVYLVRNASSQSNSTTSRKDAMEILKERYAKGEIDKKEFEEKKKAIGDK